MKTPSVMVVGGCGQVGRAAAMHLVNTTQCDVIVAGRNLKKARRCIKQHPGRMSARQLDVQHTSNLDPRLEDVDVVCGADPHPLAGSMQPQPSGCTEHHCHHP